MKHSIRLLCLIVAVCATVVSPAAQPAKRPDMLNASFAVRILFGITDKEPADWSGSVTASACKIAHVRGWHFNNGMQMTGPAAWKCSSWFGPESRRAAFDVHLPDLQREFIRPGVLVDVNAGGKTLAGASLAVTTPRGSFEVKLSELAWGVAKTFLGGAVEVLRVPVSVKPAADPAAEEDHPSIAMPRKDGGPMHVWLAYQSYADKADQIFVRRSKGAGGWEKPLLVTPKPGDYFRTAVALDAKNRLHVVWAAQVDGNFDLYERVLDGEKWSSVQRLTTAPQPDMLHRMVADASGRLYLVWQGFRDGQSDVLLKVFDGEKWGDEIRVSESKANDWEPSIAVAGDGKIVIAWDSYERGNYDIFARRFADGQLGPVVSVTSSPLFEAHAAVACDKQGRAWIAWDESGPNWGKDQGFMLEIQKLPEGHRLYTTRHVRCAVLDGKKLLAPASPATAIHGGMSEQAEQPHLVTDGAGRVWMCFRQRTSLNVSKRGVGRLTSWQEYASYYDGDRWSAAMPWPDAIGREDMRPAITQGPAGNLWFAIATDNRSFVQGAPENCDIVVGSLRVIGDSATPRDPKPAVLAAFKPAEVADATPIHPNEAADVRRIRSYRIEAAGKTYLIRRGDMHRHTDTSSDGGSDGSLMDAHRYALDAAAMDYLMCGDHNDGSKEYPWWRREKMNDLFRIGEAFVGMFGYERSINYPNGHRNVLFTKRGTMPLSPAPGEAGGGKGKGKRKGKDAGERVNSGPVVYPYLRENKGICFSHTSATNMGTDWRDNDPALEPLVEIFQGDRTNYEYLGAPWSAKEGDTGTQEGGFQPDGYVNRALLKGYKLGFQASSDHLSTHLSFSCILAEANTREALYDAMKRRHAYAATDNIIMDVRCGDRIMGDIFETAQPPALKVKVIATRPLAEVVIVKDNEVVHSIKPGGSEAEFTWTDARSAPGKHSYYYVRAVQQDQRLAWASPMWITRKP
jgi:hypothetical protein